MIQEIINQFNTYINKNNFTQEEAAKQIGCCQEHLSRILSGKKTPSVKLLMKMEEVMKNGN